MICLFNLKLLGLSNERHPGVFEAITLLCMLRAF